MTHTDESSAADPDPPAELHDLVAPHVWRPDRGMTLGEHLVYAIAGLATAALLVWLVELLA